jgi:hypothetical protein
MQRCIEVGVVFPTSFWEVVEGEAVLVTSPSHFA